MEARNDPWLRLFDLAEEKKWREKCLRSGLSSRRVKMHGFAIFNNQLATQSYLESRHQSGMGYCLTTDFIILASLASNQFLAKKATHHRQAHFPKSVTQFGSRLSLALREQRGYCLAKQSRFSFSNVSAKECEDLKEMANALDDFIADVRKNTI